MSYIEKNYRTLLHRIRAAARRAYRDPGEITVVAVTKEVTREKVKRAYDLGLVNFGENRVQEALPKIRDLPGDIKWHFIGHLQTNKVKYVIPRFTLIHSLDSLRLAKVINKEAGKTGKVFPVLVQVNVAREKTKYGLDPEEVKDFLEEVRSFPFVKVKGLMTIAPYVENPEDIRPYFRQLYQLYSSINIEGIEMTFLSMGMTNDFEVAVEEGANLIRVGTAIFKEDL